MRERTSAGPLGFAYAPDREYIDTIRRYGDRYKLTNHRFTTLTPGLERPPRSPPKTGAEAEDRERFESSIRRTKAAVHELALCNPWEYFSTWTLGDDRGFDRYDLGPWYKDFSQWIRNQRRLTGASLDYLIVPECHKDGAWHLHGLMMGLPMDKLRALSPTDYLPYRLLDKLKDGRPLYSWTAYQAKYGWCTLEPIRDKERCATYVAKYITKGFGSPSGDPGAGQKKGPAAGSLRAGSKMYYASHGLQRAVEVWRGRVRVPQDMQWDYENDYVGIAWGDSPAQWLDESQLQEVIEG